MIDKFSLTTFEIPDIDHLEYQGFKTTDRYRTKIYKYIYRLDKAVVLYHPHKFSDITNLMMPPVKIEINPKNFNNYHEMLSYIGSFYGQASIDPKKFNVTRIDIAVDIENYSIENLHACLKVDGCRIDTFSLYKGTYYYGANPKVRIYDKTKQLKAIIKNGYRPTPYELEILNSGKQYTRFEIQIRDIKKTLADVAAYPSFYVSYFDRLHFFNFPRAERAGILQHFFNRMPRKYRDEFIKYEDIDMIELIMQTYVKQVVDWFCQEEPF